MNWRMLLAWAVAAALPLAPAARAAGKGEVSPYGIDLASRAAGLLEHAAARGRQAPLLLSQTGAFRDTRNLVPAEGLIPYDLAVPFWSDGAAKLRWAAVPIGKIKYSPTGDWVFPRGTVFVKTFELLTDAAHPGVRRRLETRLLVCDSAGGASTAPCTSGARMTAMQICSKPTAPKRLRSKRRPERAALRRGTTPAGPIVLPATIRTPAAYSVSRHAR